jgi:hypothetical protein
LDFWHICQNQTPKFKNPKSNMLQNLNLSECLGAQKDSGFEAC